jgi:hypothetical protein
MHALLSQQQCPMPGLPMLEEPPQRLLRPWELASIAQAAVRAFCCGLVCPARAKAILRPFFLSSRLQLYESRIVACSSMAKGAY